jgi:hypothetical protein
MHFGCMDVILLHSGVTNLFRICGVVRTRKHFNYILYTIAFVLYHVRPDVLSTVGETQNSLYPALHNYH